MVGLAAAQRNLPFINGFSMQKICARQTSSMCTRGIEPKSSCRNFNAFEKYSFSVSGERIVSTLAGSCGRIASPPTRAQTSVTTWSLLPLSYSLYLSTSFSANILDFVYAYNPRPKEIRPRLRFQDLHKANGSSISINYDKRYL